MDIEKTMQFILERQAAHEVWLQKSEEDRKASQAAFEARQLVFERNQAAFEKNMAAIVKTQAHQLEMINRLVDDAAERKAWAKEADERAKAADERGKDMDVRLNALITIVDGMIRKN